MHLHINENFFGIFAWPKSFSCCFKQYFTADTAWPNLVFLKLFFQRKKKGLADDMSFYEQIYSKWINFFFHGRKKNFEMRQAFLESKSNCSVCHAVYFIFLNDRQLNWFQTETLFISMIKAGFGETKKNARKERELHSLKTLKSIRSISVYRKKFHISFQNLKKFHLSVWSFFVEKVFMYMSIRWFLRISEKRTESFQHIKSFTYPFDQEPYQKRYFYPFDGIQI